MQGTPKACALTPTITEFYVCLDKIRECQPKNFSYSLITFQYFPHTQQIYSELALSLRPQNPHKCKNTEHMHFLPASKVK